MGWNFGRTDLRMSASKAKFDARADGAVRLAVRRPKPRKIREKKIPIREFRESFFSASNFFFAIFVAAEIFVWRFSLPRSNDFL